METTLLVLSKLTFSVYLWCLNLALLVGALSQKRFPQKRSYFSTWFFSILSGKFKHHKYLENVNFEGKSNVVSILINMQHILIIFLKDFRMTNFFPAVIQGFWLLSFKPLKFAWNMIFLVFTRKYPLRGYIQGVLAHTTAWDQHWGGDETLKWVLIYASWLHLA